jgi:hypothetical protein
MPGARCTRGLVCKIVQRKRTRAYRFSGGNPAFPAQLVLTAYAVLSPATNVCRPRTVSIKRLRWAVHAQRALTESGSVAVRRSRFTCRSQAEARPAIRLARRHAADPRAFLRATEMGSGAIFATTMTWIKTSQAVR